jgi:hypothetical protein
LHPYQSDIQHAAETLIEGIFYEEEQLTRLLADHKALEGQLNHMANVVDFCRLNPDLDDEGIGTSVLWEAHFDVSPKADAIELKAEEVAKSIEARRISADALASGLLQVVKQGMSIVNGGLQQSPEGRHISGLKLRSVVWQARNQCMHYEEQNLNEWVVGCFVALGDRVAPVFKEYNERNLAYEVVKMLGWDKLSQFNEDLASLLPPLPVG